MPFGRFLVVEPRRRLQRHAAGGDEVARRLVDLHHGAGTHKQPRVLAKVARFDQPRKAVQVQLVAFAVTQAARQQKLLMVPVARGVDLAVQVGQRLRMAEVARLTQRQIQRHRPLRFPLCRHAEGRVQHKIHIAAAPVRVGLNRLPAAAVEITQRRRRHGVRQFQHLKGGQKCVAAVRQRRNQVQASANFFDCPMCSMIHKFLLKCPLLK